jgi:Flp pilus assembly protein TadG
MMKCVANFIRSDRGNIGLTFALLLPMLLIGTGVSVDYLRSYGAYAEMQSELDVAMIAAVKKIDNLSDTQLKTTIEDWFRTQTGVSGYSLQSVVIDRTGSTISATVHASVPTTLMQLAGIMSVPVSVVSNVSGPSTSYLDVYLVLDKSASMMLASNSSDQTRLTTALGCAFGCHSGDTHTVNGTNYASNYAYSSTHAVELRSDVLLDAVEQVLSTVEDLDPTGTRIRVGLYRLDTTTTRVLAPTASMATVRSTLTNASKGLTSSTSTDGTYFNTALDALNPLVGTGGDGKTASSPLKLVMMVTDGVQSQRGWVTSSDWNGCVWTATPTCPPSAASRQVTPLNPAWCKQIKDKAITFATVYTTYLPVTYDWGYNTTVGNTMASSVWSTTWGGTMRSGVSGSTTRRDYLPMALEDCASSSAYFMQATDVSEIAQSLTTLFKRYLSTVRLTK